MPRCTIRVRACARPEVADLAGDRFENAVLCFLFAAPPAGLGLVDLVGNVGAGLSEPLRTALIDLREIAAFAGVFVVAAAFVLSRTRDSVDWPRRLGQFQAEPAEHFVGSPEDNYGSPVS